MKSVNLNEYMYIQINEKGWEHLKKTVGEDYIKHCIDNEYYRKEINGQIWHRLQCFRVFDLLPINIGGKQLFNINIMFDDESLK